MTVFRIAKSAPHRIGRNLIVQLRLIVVVVVFIAIILAIVVVLLGFMHATAINGIN